MRNRPFHSGCPGAPVVGEIPGKKVIPPEDGKISPTAGGNGVFA